MSRTFKGLIGVGAGKESAPRTQRVYETPYLEKVEETEYTEQGLEDATSALPMETMGGTGTDVDTEGTKSTEVSQNQMGIEKDVFKEDIMDKAPPDGHTHLDGYWQQTRYGVVFAPYDQPRRLEDLPDTFKWKDEDWIGRELPDGRVYIGRDANEIGIFLSPGQAGYEQAVTHKRPIKVGMQAKANEGTASSMQAKAGENMPSSIRPARMSTGEKRRLTYTPMGPNDNVGSTPSNQPQMGGNTNTGGEVEGMSETYRLVWAPHRNTVPQYFFTLKVIILLGL